MAEGGHHPRNMPTHQNHPKPTHLLIGPFSEIWVKKYKSPWKESHLKMSSGLQVMVESTMFVINNTN